MGKNKIAFLKQLLAYTILLQVYTDFCTVFVEIGQIKIKKTFRKQGKYLYYRERTW